MVYRLNMGIFAGVWPGQEREAWEFSFRCLAGGGRFGFTQHRDGVELWDGWIRDQNRLYGRVAPLTGRRILLPGDSGVLWETRPGERLLFTFKECTVPLCGQATVTRVTADGEQAVGVSGGSLQAEPWCVYRISDGSGGNP
jgi:hypothetical protein